MAPNGSDSSKRVASNEVGNGPHTDADRLSADARPTGVPAPEVPKGVSLSVAPDCVLSRRNKPITDLACLGLVRPPFVWKFLTVVFDITTSGWSRVFGLQLNDRGEVSKVEDVFVVGDGDQLINRLIEPRDCA